MARGEARRDKHERHAFPVVRSDPVSHLRAKYRVGKAVGKGGYAVVYKGARVFDGLPVAVKKVDIRGMPDKKRERCLREVQLLGNVTHGNVVRMLDSFLDDRYLVIVFEWADGGDLRRFVRARREAKAKARAKKRSRGSADASSSTYQGGGTEAGLDRAVAEAAPLGSEAAFYGNGVSAIGLTASIASADANLRDAVR